MQVLRLGSSLALSFLGSCLLPAQRGQRVHELELGHNEEDDPCQAHDPASHGDGPEGQACTQILSFDTIISCGAGKGLCQATVRPASLIMIAQDAEAETWKCQRSS